ncbi:MAG: iron ABC transporter permease [Hyphomicrobiaceae bacterium]
MDARGKRDLLPRVGLLGCVAWLTGLPVLVVLWGATHPFGEPGAGFTLKYLHKVFLSGDYVEPLINTLMLSAAVSVLASLLALVLAFATVRGGLGWRAGWEALILSPIFISPFVGAIGWITLAQPGAGILNAVARALGLPEVDIFTWGGCILTMGLFFTPFAYGLIVHGLDRLNPEIEEAAETCGASTLARLRRITLPLIWPAVLSGLIFTFVLSMEMFSIPGILLVPQGAPFLSFSIFQRTTRWPLDYSEAAAAGVLLLLLTIAGMVLYAWSVRRQERFVAVGPKAARDSGAGASPALRGLAAALIVLYVLASVVLPVGAIALRALLPYFSGEFALSDFTLQNVADTLRDGLVRQAIVNSLLVTILASLMLVLLAYLIAVVNVRRSSLISRASALLAGLPIAVPGVLFGVGLLRLYIATPVYATIWLIVLVMLARFLPILVRMFETSLIQIGAVLEEAARVSGAREPTLTLRIRLPLLIGTLRSAFVLGGTQVLNELTASALLTTSSSIVLPVVVFNYMFDGDYPRACSVALLQVVLLAMVVAIVSLLARGKRRSAATPHGK